MASEHPAPLSVGVNTMSFMWRARARDALETLARRGYRRFEIMAQRPHLDPMMEHGEAAAFGRFLRDAGLTVETINMPSLDQNLASASPEMRAYTVRLFERLIAIAETIGASGVITVTGRVNPLIAPARRDLESWFYEAFERVHRAAESAGVRLWLENIPMGVYPRADQLIAFADRVGSPAVGICYDIANAHFIGEDTAEGLRKVRSRLGIVHLSDSGREAWRHDPVGQGSCDFAGFGAALREIGYAGTSMLEIVADPPVEHIVASHRRLAQWGWAPPQV
ncbi:MAG TPA: sugar phosphate isomerase/epimerase family protein [Burkholderiales bacterium]|nr:sugar phosphate isomerase/epimerase family protein [Burkholderiales bacterium]